MSVEVRDVAEGLWLWRQPHPDWTEDNDDWEPEVSSFAVRSNGVHLLLDPLAPHPSASEVYDRIERVDAIVVLKPDHVRDVDLFARWYKAEAHGPFLFWAGEAPHTELKPLRPGDELPGGIYRARRRARDDGDAAVPARAGGAGVRRRADRARTASSGCGTRRGTSRGCCRR